MKKLCRKIWIALLTAVATLASCNLFSPPACYYGPAPIDKTNEDSIANIRKKAEQRRLDSIRAVKGEQISEPVYSVPNIEERRERLIDMPR